MVMASGKDKNKDIVPTYSIGHFINEPSNPTEFEIVRYQDLEEPDVEELHKHAFYAVLWIDEGVSQQIIDYQEYVIEPGTLFFISPGQVHYFEEWQPLVGGTIFFTDDFFLLHHQNKDTLFELEFLDNLYAQPFVKLDATDYAATRQMIELIYDERKKPDYSADIVRSLLHVLLLQIQRHSRSLARREVPRRSIILYKMLKELIETHFLEGLSASDYAERLNCTQHHLNHVVRQVTGQTTSEVVRARSILEAKRLLTFTGKTVTEIAAELGFFDSSYFAKLFKADAGVSPVEFKKAMSEAMSERYRTTTVPF